MVIIAYTAAEMAKAEQAVAEVGKMPNSGGQVHRHHRRARGQQTVGLDCVTTSHPLHGRREEVGRSGGGGRMRLQVCAQPLHARPAMRALDQVTGPFPRFHGLGPPPPQHLHDRPRRGTFRGPPSGRCCPPTTRTVHLARRQPRGRSRTSLANEVGPRPVACAMSVRLTPVSHIRSTSCRTTIGTAPRHRIPSRTSR